MLKDFVDGIAYNLKGLVFGVKTPKLLLLGILRFAVLIILTILCATMVFQYHETILSMVWAKPDSVWIVWLWHLLSWCLSLLLVGVSVLFSYLVSQLLFSVLIMDLMSTITERLVTGKVEGSNLKFPIIKKFFYLVRQEIPRSILPVLFAFIVMVFGWITPLGPLVAILSSAIAVIFLAWDNTDLVLARRLEPFKKRFRFFVNKFTFHLGFGLLFLVPGFNIVFLSFAPVGGTLYMLDNRDL